MMRLHDEKAQSIHELSDSFNVVLSAERQLLKTRSSHVRLSEDIHEFGRQIARDKVGFHLNKPLSNSHLAATREFLNFLFHTVVRFDLPLSQ